MLVRFHATRAMRASSVPNFPQSTDPVCLIEQCLDLERYPRQVFHRPWRPEEEPGVLRVGMIATRSSRIAILGFGGLGKSKSDYITGMKAIFF